MKIDVIMPVYNAARYVTEAIENVLGQVTDHELELIVMDDGSTDASAGEIQAFGDAVRYFHQDNAGIGAARNRAIALGDGDCLAFLDADDLWTPGKTQLQMDRLAEQPGLEAVFGHSVQFLSPELDPDEHAHLGVVSEPNASELSCTMLIRREAFERVGPYSETFLGCDVDWRMRSQEAGLRSEMLPDVVLKRRVHPGSFTYRNRDRLDYARILKSALDRRRQKT